MKKKWLGLVMLAVASVVFAACGSNSASTDSSGSGKNSSDSDTTENLLAKIQKKGTIVMGTSADFAPFEFKTLVDGKDTIVGSDVELGKAIAKELGVKLKIVDMEFKSLISAMQAGQVDMIISGMSSTPERKKNVDFSVNYYNPPQVVVVRKADVDKYTTIASMDGKKIGVQTGSLQEEIQKDQFPKTKAVSVAKVPNLIMELNSGSVDGVILEKTIAEAYIEQNPDLTLSEITPESSDDEAFAVAMPKDSTELKAKIDTLIGKLQADGTIDKQIQEAVKLSNESAE